MKMAYAMRNRYLREREDYERERLRNLRNRLKISLVIPYILIFIICFIDVFDDYRVSAVVFVSYCIFAITTYLTFAFHVIKPDKRRYKELQMVRRWIKQEGQ